MNIKTWRERIDASYPHQRSPALVEHYMQAEIDELRAALQERDAEIERFNSHIHTCGPTCTKAGCINARLSKELEQLTETSIWQAGRISELLDDAAAQRKVLEMALEALQSLFSFEVDEHRGERCASAITAIQEQLA